MQRIRIPKKTAVNLCGSWPSLPELISIYRCSPVSLLVNLTTLLSSFFYRLANGFTLSPPLHVHFHWIRSSLPCTAPASTKHTIFASTIIAVLLCFIQMKYENKNFSPFDTHPKTMNASILNLLIYCISSMAEATLNRAIFVLVFVVTSVISQLLF